MMFSCLLAAEASESLQVKWLTAFRQGEFKQGIAVCSDALADAQAPALWWSYKGLCLSKLGEHDRAVDAFRRGLAGNDHHFDIYFMRAYINSLIACRLYHTAQAFIDRAQRDYPAAPAFKKGLLTLALKNRQRDVVNDNGVQHLTAWMSRSWTQNQIGLCLALAMEMNRLSQRQTIQEQSLREAFLHGGMAALQLRAATDAVYLLQKLPADFAGGKAGLSLALSHLLNNDRVASRRILEDTLAGNPQPDIQQSCLTLLQKLRD